MTPQQKRLPAGLALVVLVGILAVQAAQAGVTTAKLGGAIVIVAGTLLLGVAARLLRKLPALGGSARAALAARASLSEEAAALDLRFEPARDAAVGLYNTVEVSAAVGLSGMRVEAEVPAAIHGVRIDPDDDPERDDIQLGRPWLDAALQIRGRDEARIRALLLDEEVLPLLDRLHREGTGLQVRDHRVGLQFREFPRGTLRPRLDRVTQLARALGRAWDRELRTVAGDRGLTLRQSERSGTWSMTGSIEGLYVTVGASADGAATVQVRLPEPARWSLRITHSDLAQTPGLELSDPVLASAVHVHTSDPERARALLDDDATRERVLALVHGHMGSRITDDKVEVNLARVPADLGEVIDDAMAVAKRLRS